MVMELRNQNGKIVGIDSDGNVVPVEFGSLSTGDTVTETLSYDYSQNNPQQPRQPEQSGPLTARPHPDADNPVMTAADVNDVTDVNFVGDPFVVYDSGMFYLFFEIEHNGSDPDIGYATSVDGLSYTYQSRIINDDQWRAYPLVFQWKGEWYMLSDGFRKSGVPVFKSTNFPTDWEYQYDLLDNSRVSGEFLDPATFKFNDLWWILATDSDSRAVYGYYTDEFPAPDTDWSAHDNNPLYDDPKTERSGGRPFPTENYVDLFFRDESNSDRRISYQRVTDLTPTSITTTEVASSPIVTRGDETWIEAQVGHIDPVMSDGTGQDISLVQGRDANDNISIGVYTTGFGDHDHAGDTLRPNNITLTPDNAGNVSTFVGDRVAVTGSETIFDLAEPVDVIGGHVTGRVPDGLVITWADGSTDTLNSGIPRGVTSATGQISEYSIPPLVGVQKLEFTVASDGDEYGWLATTV